MELQRLRFQRYKSFDRETTVEIAPLTILVGANNSGKTAFAQAVHFLSSNLSLPDDDRTEPLLLNSDGVQHGRIFEDLITRRSAHGELSLSAALGSDGNETMLSVRIQNIISKSRPSESRQQISYWALSGGTCQFEAVNESLNEQSRYKISGSGGIQEEQQVSWRGLLPRRSNPFPDWVNGQIDTIRQWASGVRYLKCPRSFSSSRLSLSDYSLSLRDAAGKTAPLEFAASDDLRDSVKEWYQRVFGVRLDIRKKADLFDLIVESPYYGTDVSLNQSGAGLAQVLPVVINAFTAKGMGPGVDIIEHPEAELHPSAHADVAELLLNNLPGPARPIIIETHSEMILLRTRRLIAAGQLSPDDVLIYWICNKPEHGSKLQKIRITDDGAMSRWPEGVFYEDYEEVLAIRRAARDRRR